MRWDEDAGRWRLDGKPVHAGDGAELRGFREPTDVDRRARGEMDPGDWVLVRLESREGGRELDAYLTVAGLTFKRHVAGFAGERLPDGRVVDVQPWHETMRWPR